jgi:Tfp pilus assembly protein PilV
MDGTIGAIIIIEIRMNTKLNRSPAQGTEQGTTLVEVMVTAVLVAVFFASIFELNAMCLRFIDASKESLAALQSVQDRSETLRNLSFSDLTNTAVVQARMATAANPAPFSQKATEVVKISKYPTPNGVTQFTRSSGGTVVNDSVATDLGTQLVKVDVAVSWTMTLGGRARTEQTSSIVSNGTKK